MTSIQKLFSALFIVISTFISFSSISQTHAQVATMPIRYMPCVTIPTNLMIGSSDAYSGSYIRALQTYLYEHGYLLHEPTGYFGSLTRGAVVSFQRAQGISPTGYVGPMTREQIQKLTCGTVQNPVSISYATPTTAQVGTNVTLVGSGFSSDSVVYFGGAMVSPLSTYDSATTAISVSQLTFTVPSHITPCPPNANCIMMAREVTPGVYPVYVVNTNGVTSNMINFTVSGADSKQQFSVTGIDAPTTVPVNNTGTWTVRVNSTGGNLRYGVLWGDEYIAYPSLLDKSIMAPVPQVYQSNATFTHVYTRTGTYNPVFTVTDDSGRTGTISTNVTVTPIYLY